MEWAVIASNHRQASTPSATIALVKGFRTRSALLLAVLSLAAFAWPCSWAFGYFHQITNLRGTVVGVNRGDFRHISRWMRQRVVRNGVTLTLYDYRWPVSSQNEMPIVRTLRTDSDGHFDFGVLKDGHYALVIDDPWGGSDRYDVQIVQNAKATSSVKIDISPVYPDCKGGHEFIVE